MQVQYLVYAAPEVERVAKEPMSSLYDHQPLYLCPGLKNNSPKFWFYL